MEGGIIILDRSRGLTGVARQLFHSGCPIRLAMQQNDAPSLFRVNELLICVVRCTIKCCVPLNDINKKSP